MSSLMRRVSAKMFLPSLRRHEVTFVSKHFKVETNEIQSVLEAMQSRHRRADGHYEVQICNLCDKGNKQKEDNMWKLYVNDDGSYRCFRCSKGGSWFDLKRKVGMGGVSTPGVEVTQFKTKELAKLHPPLPADQITGYAKMLCRDEEGPRKVLEYLTETRGITKGILQRYGVGFAVEKFRDENDDYQDHLCITFPWMEEKIHPKTKKSASVDKAEEINDIQNALLMAASGASLPVETNQAATSWEGPVSPEVLQEWDGELDPIEESDPHSANITSQKPKFDAVRVKFRALAGKGKQRLFPKGGPWGFFGWHTVKPTDISIIITEGEFDAMAVAQVTSKLPIDSPLHKIPAISLPNGASSLPPELLPRLERFTKIYLWMDSDGPGSIAAEKFSRKLGLRRCVVVKPLPNMENPPKDANDALRLPSGKAIVVSMLEAATTVSHDRLSHFKDLRTATLAYISRGDSFALGTQTPSLPKLTDITKGFREGELVVFTGPTGAGKTTLLSQLTLDFAKTGAPTLWGSFEIQNIQLLQKMLQQFNKDGKLSLLPPEKISALADKFEALPLTFMNFHGGSSLEEILDAMEYAVYQYDIKHVVLDNLQFMMPRTSRHFDKFEAQDAVVDAFRKFATEKLVNIILVIHPRKEDDRMPLHMASIFGSAKATQEADIVMILQRVEGETSVEIRKNRYDGQLGKVLVDFNQISTSFYQLDN